MPRLIDANALKKEAWPERYTGEGIIYVEDVDKAPTVDAVEVVRCRDCKYWHEETGFCAEHSCFDKENMEWQMFDADYFCKDGERKDNEC